MRDTPKMMTKIIGGGSQYAVAFADLSDPPLVGAKNYKINVPANVPCNRFWSVVLYDPQTRSQLQTINRDDNMTTLTSPLASDPNSPQPAGRWRWYHLLGVAVGALVVAYLLIAYVVAPLAWEEHFHRHPSLDDIPGITQTNTGISGDPLNVALVGTKEQVEAIMQAAKWYPADALGLRSDIKIAEDTVFKRPDDEAPVSSLYLFGRKEDLAFEQPVGPDPRQRHHVRFWKTRHLDTGGRPYWIGSASYDERVGFSHTTGEITHHTAADVDVERDHIFQTLEATGDLAEHYVKADFHKTLEGRNGGGDPWHTDGSLYVGVIKNIP